MVPALQFTYWQWISLTLAAPVAVWGAWPFHRAAWTEPAPRRDDHGHARLDGRAGGVRLVGVGAAPRYGRRAGHGAPVHVRDLPRRRGGADLPGGRGGRHDVPAGGRYFEARSKRRAGAALRALLELGAKDVAVLRPTASGADGRELRIPIGRLAVGDRFVVRPGEKVATDGVVEEGRSAVDAALLTGESVPVDVGPGDAVVGATVNAGGRLVVRATRVGADTQLAQMAKLVDDAQSGKAPVQRLADRISGVFVPIVIALAAAHVRVLARHRRGCRRGLHRRRRGADHRLPVRAGSRDADGAARRHRPRRQAGHPDQGPGGAGGDPARRHRRAGQDRHGDGGPDGAGRGARRRRRRRGRGAAAGRGGGGRARSTRWRRRSSRGASPAQLPAAEDFENVEGLGVQGVVDGHVVLVGRPALLDAVEHRAAAVAGRGAGRRAVPRAYRGGGGVGRRGAGGARGRRHRQADVGRGRRPAARARPASGAADRRQRGGGPAPWPRRSVSTT